MLFPIYYIKRLNPTANTVFRLLVQGQILLVWGQVWREHGERTPGPLDVYFSSQDSWLRNAISEFFNDLEEVG